MAKDIVIFISSNLFNISLINMSVINSLDNPIIKNIERLKKSSVRNKQKVFLVDGVREISLALEAGLKLINLFYCPELSKKSEEFIKLSAKIRPEKIKEVKNSVFKKICYKENPDGFLAEFSSDFLKIEDIRLGKNPLIIILEKVEKPGNLGAILRTAYAAGIKFIILNDNQTDIYNPNVIRASEGYVFSEQIIKLSVDETILWLQKNKIRSFGTATIGKSVYIEANLAGAAAIVLGSEADGLSKKWLESADQLIKIPMVRGMDSLNVSVAAAVIMFESLRQRGL